MKNYSANAKRLFPNQIQEISFNFINHLKFKSLIIMPTTLAQTLFWISMLIASATTVSHAASFDCIKSNTKVEQMICEDRWLNDMDEQISHIFNSLISESSHSIALDLQKSQNVWIHEVRNQCTSNLCLIGVFQDRRWELASQLKDFDCEDYAISTREIDECGRTKFEKIDKKLQKTYGNLLKALESPDCCFSENHKEVRKLAIESQEYWLKFRTAECQGHYETIAAGSLRGSFYNDCAKSLTEQRIKQLLQWGMVGLEDQETK